MKRLVLLAIFTLVCGSAVAAPTCYSCQGIECWSSIMYWHKSCIANSWSCYAFDDCPYWLADNTACRQKQQWQLARSETFTGLQVSQRIDWRLSGSVVKPAAVDTAALR